MTRPPWHCAVLLSPLFQRCCKLMSKTFSAVFSLCTTNSGTHDHKTPARVSQAPPRGRRPHRHVRSPPGAPPSFLANTSNHEASTAFKSQGFCAMWVVWICEWRHVQNTFTEAPATLRHDAAHLSRAASICAAESHTHCVIRNQAHAQRLFSTGLRKCAEKYGRATCP